MLGVIVDGSMEDGCIIQNDNFNYVFQDPSSIIAPVVSLCNVL